MKIIQSLVCMFSIALMPTSAKAEQKAEIFIQYIQNGGVEKDIAELSLDMMFRGMFWANAAIQLQGRKEIFCQPEGMALESEQIVSIFRNFVERNPRMGDKPSGAVLMFAMEKTFPCPKGD